MSTILKALAKLEREKEALRVAGPVPVIRNSGPGMGRPSGWYLKPWLWSVLVGFIIVVLGSTAWYFYRQSRDRMPQLAERSAAMEQPPAQRHAENFSRSAPPPMHETARPEPRPTEPKPVSTQNSEHFQATGDHGRPSHPGNPSVAATAKEPPPARENPAVQQPMPSVSPARTPKRASPHRAPEKTAPAMEAGGNQDAAPDGHPSPPDTAPKEDDHPSPPDTAPKENSPADVYSNTPLLTDGRLRVHAIAWAPQPAERMAVINSHILHEGDSVDDFAVMVIRPDDVVVREKGKGVWRVEFGRP